MNRYCSDREKLTDKVQSSASDFVNLFFPRVDLISFLGFLLEHGSNALDIPGLSFSASMSVALPNSRIDLVLVLNDASADKMPLSFAIDKVGTS